MMVRLEVGIRQVLAMDMSIHIRILCPTTCRGLDDLNVPFDNLLSIEIQLKALIPHRQVYGVP